MYLKKIFNILFIFFVKYSYSQNLYPAIDSKFHYGFIWAHTPKLNHLSKHIQIFELSYYFNTDGSKKWHILHNFPEYGISVLYVNYNQAKIIGNAFAINPFFSFPLLRKKKYQFNFKLATGIGMIQKPFDRIDNNKNVAIGSKLNASIELAFLYKRQISKYFKFNTGIFLTHFSNAAYSKPNSGINSISFSTGISYAFKGFPTLNKISKEDSIAKIADKKIKFIILPLIGIKGISVTDKRKYFVATISTGLEKRISRKSLLSLKSDFFYDDALVDKAAFKGEHLTDKDKLRIGLLLEYSFKVYKFIYFIQYGTYVFQKYFGDGYFYHRIGIRYTLNKNLQFNLGLKTHFAVADNIEIGLLYKLNL